MLAASPAQDIRHVQQILQVSLPHSTKDLVGKDINYLHGMIPHHTTMRNHHKIGDQLIM